MLRWGLPALAFGLGGMALLATGLQLACRCGPPNPSAFLVGLYFASSGFVALVARWRAATGLADGALFAIGFGIVVGALGIEAHKLLVFQRPIETLSGQLTSVSVSHLNRGHGVDANLTLADGRSARWTCGSFCRDRYDALRSLRWDVPIPAQMQVAGNQLIGLTADGVQILDPERERTRQFGVRVLSVGFCGLILAGLALFGYSRQRRPKASYLRPAPIVLPKLRRPRP